MKDLIEEKRKQEPEDAPLQARAGGGPAVGLERATEIDTAGAAAVVPPGPSRNMGDRIFGGLVRFSVWLFLGVLVGVAIVLIVQSLPSIRWSGLSFFTREDWDPVKNVYGVGPVILGTLVVAGIAMLLAGTVGLASAIFLVDFAPRWLREPVAFLIELLAFIPSVVYGLWGLLIMSPWLQQTVQPWIQQNLGFISFFN